MATGEVREGRLCEACGAQIWWKRPQARFCNADCRKKAHLERKRSARSNRTVLSPEDGYFEALGSDRGYIDDWQPHKKTQVMLSRVQDVLEEYREQLPLTNRQIYYRMIGRFSYPKGEQFERSLYGMLAKARRAGAIAFDDIRDDGITGFSPGGYGGVDDFLERWRFDATRYYRDVSEDQPVRVEVWCEAAGMAPQLSRVAQPYGIPVYSCGGFDSLTAKRQIVNGCIFETNGPTQVLHLGDCDPSGFSIYQSVFEDVSAFLERDRRRDEQTFSAERVALTREQVKEHNLPEDEIKTNDSRSRIWRARGFTTKVEIEALAPDVIADLLREAIERHVDTDAIARMRSLEKAESAVLVEGVEAARLAVGPPQKLNRLARLLEEWAPTNGHTSRERAA
jgi:hypothetical protein